MSRTVSSEPAATTDPRRWWRRLVPIVAALLSLATIEIALRRPEPPEPQVFAEDPDLGWGLRPNQSMWFESGEGRAWVETNGDGMRDREYPVAKPAGTTRVAVLGDSFMMGYTLSAEETFPRALNAQLGACRATAAPIEVMNFGVPGYGTVQELLQYRKKVSKYHPDIVVLSFYAGNDIFNNSPSLDLPGDTKPPYVSIRDGVVAPLPPEAPPAPRREPWHRRARLWLTDRVRTASLLYDAYAQLRAAISPPAPARPVSSRATVLDMLRPPATPDMASAWELTEGLLLALSREVEAGGGEFWLMTISINKQVDPDLARRALLARALGVKDLWYPDHRLRDFAAREHIRLISLAEPLADYAAREQVLLHNPSTEDMPGTHWTARGAAAAAAIAARQLCRDSAVLGAP